MEYERSDQYRNSELLNVLNYFYQQILLQLTLCKDKQGKIGIRVRSISNGVFVCFVSQESPAAIAGLRFGDQILEINGESVAGYSMDKVHNLLRNAPTNGIKTVIRDRYVQYFHRTLSAF